MLLPTKGISARRALLTIGANVVRLLDSPATVSGLWERFVKANDDSQVKVTFDWFALTLSMLYAVGAVAWNANDQLERRCVSA
jgi:hypothetical protein